MWIRIEWCGLKWLDAQVVSRGGRQFKDAFKTRVLFLTGAAQVKKGTKTKRKQISERAIYVFLVKFTHFRNNFIKKFCF